MTHDEWISDLNKYIAVAEIATPATAKLVSALRAVVEYSKELSQTDYRGNPPVEHYISAKLMQIIEKELV